jgi:hypothetical protein
VQVSAGVSGKEQQAQPAAEPPAKRSRQAAPVPKMRAATPLPQHVSVGSPAPQHASARNMQPYVPAPASFTAPRAHDARAHYPGGVAHAQAAQPVAEQAVQQPAVANRSERWGGHIVSPSGVRICLHPSATPASHVLQPFSRVRSYLQKPHTARIGCRRGWRH